MRVVEGATFGDELLMKEEGREYVVGRAPSCDLVLDDREVSREHLKLVRRGYVVFIKDLSSTRGSWLGRAAVYTGATIEWSRPRMLRLGATVLSLELPAAIRRAAGSPQASAPMTPPPRARRNTSPSPNAHTNGSAMSGASGVSAMRGASSAASATPPSSARRGRGSTNPTPPPSRPPPESDAALAVAAEIALTRRKTPSNAPPRNETARHADGAPPVAAVSSPPTLTSSRKAWKGSGTTIGRTSGLLLLALGGIVVLGVLFVVFSLLE